MKAMKNLCTLLFVFLFYGAAAQIHVNSAADIPSLAGIAGSVNIGDIITTRGYYPSTAGSLGDEGHGTYLVSSEAPCSTCPNNAAIIKILGTVNPVLYARLQSNNGKFNLLQFGARNDGSEDATKALNNAINYTNDYAWPPSFGSYTSYEIIIPHGAYIISEEIKLKITTKLIGIGMPTFRVDEEIGIAFSNQSPTSLIYSTVFMENIQVDCNNMADVGIYMENVSHSAPKEGLSAVRVKNANETGFLFYECQAGSFEKLHASYCGVSGFQIIGCNGSSFSDLTSTFCPGAGVIIQGDLPNYLAGGCSFYNLHVEQNSGPGVLIEESHSPINFFGGWCEGNNSGFVLQNTNSVNVEGFRLDAGAPLGSENNPAFHIRESSANTMLTVKGCFLGGGSNRLLDEGENSLVNFSSISGFNDHNKVAFEARGTKEGNHTAFMARNTNTDASSTASIDFSGLMHGNAQSRISSSKNEDDPDLSNLKLLTTEIVGQTPTLKEQLVIDEEGFVTLDQYSNYENTECPDNIAWFNKDGRIEKTPIEDFKACLGVLAINDKIDCDFQKISEEGLTLLHNSLQKTEYRHLSILNDITGLSEGNMPVSYTVSPFLDGYTLSKVYYSVATNGSDDNSNTVELLIDNKYIDQYSADLKNNTNALSKGDLVVSSHQKIKFEISDLSNIPPNGLSVELEFTKLGDRPQASVGNKISSLNGITTKISQIQETKVFPNPTSGFINIIGEDFSEWTLLDSNGVLILNGTAKSVNLEPLSDGNYILILKNKNNQTEAKQIVKITED